MMFSAIQKTMTEGTELIFAANYLGPFLLTTSMLGKLCTQFTLTFLTQ